MVEWAVRADVTLDRAVQVVRPCGLAHLGCLLRSVPGQREVPVDEVRGDLTRHDRSDGRRTEPHRPAGMIQEPGDRLGLELGLVDRWDGLGFPFWEKTHPAELRVFHP